MNSDVKKEQLEINHQVEDAKNKILELEEELRLVDIEIDTIFTERQQYVLLSEINDRLEKLNAMGGADLFWGDGVDANKPGEHCNRINNLVINYDESVKIVKKKREQN